MKKEIMKLLRQMMAEDDAAERLSIKRTIVSDFRRLRFIQNDREGEDQNKIRLKNCMDNFCRDASPENRSSLLDCAMDFEKKFV